MMPFSPLKASVRRNSTPGMRSAMILSFSILCLSRPILVSSSSSRPSCSACSMQILRMQATALRRSSRPRALKLALCLDGRGDGGVDVVEDARAARRDRCGSACSAGDAHVAHPRPALAARRCGSDSSVTCMMASLLLPRPLAGTRVTLLLAGGKDRFVLDVERYRRCR